MKKKASMYWINITELCENKCIWCYEANQRDLSLASSTMPYEKATSIIDEMSISGGEDCILIGGEPLQHPDVFKIAKYAKSKNQRVFLVTNGRKFSNISFAQKAADLDINLVQISAHGWNQESYKINTGSNRGFEEMLRAVKNLLSCGAKVGIGYVLTKQIEPHIEEAVSLASNIGIDFLEFNIGAPSISPDNINGEFTIPMNRQNEVVMEAFRTCQKFGIKSGFNLTTPHCLFTEADLKMLMEHAVVSSGCALKSGSGVVFKVNGAITGCNHFKDFEMADQKEAEAIISNSNFVEFWNCEKAKEIREESNRYTSKACSECPRWDKCGGGCIVSWAYHDPSSVPLKPIN